MPVSRRSFIGAIFATAAAPAIVKAENISKIWVPSKKILTWEDFNGTGKDCTEFLQFKLKEAYAAGNYTYKMPLGIFTLGPSFTITVLD